MLAFVAGLLVACSNSKDKQVEVKYHDLKMERMNGDIIAIEETPYKTDSTGKAGEMDSCCIAYSELDENGNYIRYTEKDSKGTIKNQFSYTHYPDGMWKGYVQTKDGKSAGTMETMADAKGNYTMAISYDSANKVDRKYTGLTQNENAQVLTWKGYDKDSVFREEGILAYDKGLQTSFTLKDSVGKVKQESTFKYNDKGEQTEVNSTTVTKDSTTKKLTKYSYDTHDDKGNWTQRTEWDDKGKPVKIVKRVYTYKKDEAKK